MKVSPFSAAWDLMLAGMNATTRLSSFASLVKSYAGTTKARRFWLAAILATIPTRMVVAMVSCMRSVLSPLHALQVRTPLAQPGRFFAALFRKKAAHWALAAVEFASTPLHRHVLMTSSARSEMKFADRA